MCACRAETRVHTGCTCAAVFQVPLDCIVVQPSMFLELLPLMAVCHSQFACTMQFACGSTCIVCANAASRLVKSFGFVDHCSGLNLVPSKLLLLVLLCWQAGGLAKGFS
jgi:hypothetical protein